MAFALTVPKLGVGKKGFSKDIVVGILSHEWPLSTKQLYSMIRREANFDVTYQAVHKILKDLVDACVIYKVEGKYRLHLSWIKEIKNFANVVENNYIKGNKSPLIKNVTGKNASENVIVLDFNSLIEMDKCWMDIETSYVLNLTKDDCSYLCWMGRHTWWVFAYPDEEYKLNKKILDAGAKVYMLCKGNKPLDMEANLFYKSMGISFNYGVNCAENSDILIFGDNVMQMIYPAHIKEEIDKIYLSVKRSSEIDMPNFIKNILTKKIRVQIVINKNKDLAEQLRQSILTHFKGDLVEKSKAWKKDKRN